MSSETGGFLYFLHSILGACSVLAKELFSWDGEALRERVDTLEEALKEVTLAASGVDEDGDEEGDGGDDDEGE